MKIFNITAEMRLDVDLQISAEDLDDALEQAKKLKEHDFVKFKGDYIDGEFSIRGVYRTFNGFEKKD